jgi:maltose/moltooligosaccharide transporter
MVTVLFAKEYNPEEYAKYHDHSQDTSDQKGIIEIIDDFKRIPKTMMQLGLVQFFSWFGLFCMWVYTTKAVAQNAYGLPAIGEGYEGSAKTIFDTAGDWVGILFGIYNGISAIYALMLPRIVKRIGRKNTHAISLIAGSIGMLSMFVIKDPQLLIYSMIGIGMAWASILAMPYAILAGSIPDGKMGVFMGIFNFFITIPQIVSAIVLGPIVAGLFDNHAIFALVMGGIMLLIAAVSVRFVVEKQPSTEVA